MKLRNRHPIFLEKAMNVKDLLNILRGSKNKEAKSLLSEERLQIFFVVNSMRRWRKLLNPPKNFNQPSKRNVLVVREELHAVLECAELYPVIDVEVTGIESSKSSKNKRGMIKAKFSHWPFLEQDKK